MGNSTCSPVDRAPASFEHPETCTRPAHDDSVLINTGECEALGLPGYQALEKACRNAPSGRDWSCLQNCRLSVWSAAQLPMAAKQSQDQTCLQTSGYQALEKAWRKSLSGMDWSFSQYKRLSVWSAAQLPMPATQLQSIIPKHITIANQSCFGLEAEARSL